MRIVERGAGWFLAIGLALSAWCVADAAEPPGFPEPLMSFWEPGLPCDTGETSDRDARFEITSMQRLNYEEIEDLVSAELLTSSPWTWRILTTSNIGPENLEQPFIYVLEGDLLTVADGRSAKMYMRCK